jgi:amino acid transporter
VALTYLDIAMDFPEAGGPSRFAIYSHGQATSLINGMADLIWYLFISPLESYVFVALVIHEFFPQVLNPATGNYGHHVHNYCIEV